MFFCNFACFFCRECKEQTQQQPKIFNTLKHLISAITRERYVCAFCLLLAVLIVSIGETNAVENTTQRIYSAYNSSFRANNYSHMQVYDASASYCFTPASAEETGTGAGYSAYSPAITQVGATQAAQMAWTSEDDAYSPGGRTRRGLTPGLSDPNRDKASPVGEAWALLLFGALYLGYTLLRKKKAEPGKS